MSRRAPAVVLAVVVGLAALLHLWIVSGGRWSFETNPSGTLYRRQAEAFRAGQFALLEAPPAALLALPDPYDPRQWRTLPIDIDVSLFGERFYLYFGPAPALVLTAAASVKAMSNDGLAGLGFDLLWLVLVPIAVTLLRRRIAPDGSWLVDLAATLALALAAPLGFILGRLATYETAILAGQAFLLLGIVLAAGARGRGIWLGAAGLAIGLAASSRLTLLPALMVLVGVLALLQPSPRSSLGWLGAPLLAMLALLGLFNLARFGSPLESGWQYQLTALPQRAWLDQMFSLANLPVTSGWYLARPPLVSWSPPILLPRPASPAEAIALASWFQEPIGAVGILWSAPLVLLGGAATIVLLARRRCPPLVAGLWLAGVAAALPVLLFRAVHVRYQLDFLPLLLLAAALAIQRVLPHRGTWRSAWLTGALAAATAGAIFGVAGGVAMRNSRAGFADADGLVALLSRRVPAVDAVGRALDWLGERHPAGTVALIAEPLPTTPTTIDIGTPVQVEVIAASSADPCWAFLPGPGVVYRLSNDPVGAIATFEPRLFGLPVGPTVFVAPHTSPAPAPLSLTSSAPATLCPIAGPATFGAQHFRQYRTRAFWTAGEVTYQPVEATGTVALRLTAHGAFDAGRPPELTVELRRSPTGDPIARRTIAIDRDWHYAPFDLTFSAEGPVYPVLRFEGPVPRGPWWAVAVASLEAQAG